MDNKPVFYTYLTLERFITNLFNCQENGIQGPL